MEPNIPPFYSLQGKNVMLATDGKPSSEKAMWVAIEISKLLGSKLLALMVINDKSPEDEKKSQIREAKKNLNAIVDQASDHGVDVTALLEGGSPSETIVFAVERLNVGLLVVGTSEKSRLDRVLIGSVSEHVVRNSPCSVIVVK
jgi:nucleotide-binding universal stress UspA family protein